MSLPLADSSSESINLVSASSLAKRLQHKSLHRVWLGLFLTIFLAVSLIGSDRMPLIDRDEGWYTAVSRAMLEQGDWVVPRFRGEVFSGKPVLAYWFQATSMAIFGATPFAARFPSAVCGVLTLSLLWWGTKRSLGEARAM